MTSRDTLIYLASPYNHASAFVREHRYRLALRAVGRMMLDGEVVYSPIVHNHPIACTIDLPKDWDFWKRIDLAILARCDILRVLCIPGYESSIGVAAEIQFASDQGKIIQYVFDSSTDKVAL